MTTDWAVFTGLTVGPWRLDSLLRVHGARACFLSSDSANSEKALIQVVLAEEAGSANQRQSWELATGLSSSDIVHVLETARTEFDGIPVQYAVQEMPDDALDDLLANRALDMEEARALIASLAGALEYLHHRGLRHGAVHPSNVLLVKDRVKLTADSIAPSAGPADCEADIRQMGMTLVQAMTQDADPAAARRLPPAMRDIATACLAPSGRQWSAARVLRAVSGSPAPPAEAAPAAIAVLQGSDETPPPVVETETNEKLRPSSSMRRKLQYVGAAAFALIALVSYRAIKQSGHATAQAPQRLEQPVRATAPAPQAIPPKSAVRPPAEPVEKPSPIPGARPRKALRTTADANTADRVKGPRSWAVIAATYTDFDMAQKRAGRIAKLSPKLQAGVYPPSGEGSRYYVVLGTGLSRAEAEDVCRIALDAGAPKDTYVTMLKQE